MSSSTHKPKRHLKLVYSQKLAESDDPPLTEGEIRAVAIIARIAARDLIQKRAERLAREGAIDDEENER